MVGAGGQRGGYPGHNPEQEEQKTLEQHNFLAKETHRSNEVAVRVVQVKRRPPNFGGVGCSTKVQAWLLPPPFMRPLTPTISANESF
ncbi:hypothetical protein GCM10027511_21400 [Hymenobacter humi]